MSVIEKLDGVLARLGETSEGNYLSRLANGTSIALEAVNLLRDHGPAIRQAMIDAERYRWLRDQANFAERVAPQVCVLDCLTGESKPLNGAEVDAVIDDRLQKIETGANHADA